MPLVAGGLMAGSVGRSGSGFAATKRLLRVECGLWKIAVRELLSGCCDASSNWIATDIYTSGGRVARPAGCSEMLHQ